MRSSLNHTPWRFSRTLHRRNNHSMPLSVWVNVDSPYWEKRVTSEVWCSIKLKWGHIHLLRPYRSIWHYFTAKHTERNTLIHEQESFCSLLVLGKKKKKKKHVHSQICPAHAEICFAHTLNNMRTVKKYAAFAFLLFSQGMHKHIFTTLFRKHLLCSHVHTLFSSVLEFHCSYTAKSHQAVRMTCWNFWNGYCPDW